MTATRWRTTSSNAEEAALLEDMVLTINTFFGWDFNSCETLRADGVFYPIDFANACPDSQVTSLHYHFPWLIKALLRWSLFCAATQRPMRRTLDWAPYYEIADRDLPYREKLAAYAAIARKRLDTDRFEEFCAEHLGALDETLSDFFGSDLARDAVRQKVTALFPEHEIDEFTDYFWDKIQQWRADEGAGSARLKLRTEWHSQHLQRTVTIVRWGYSGTPVLLFPTAGGDAEECERFLMLQVLAPLARERPHQGLLLRQRRRQGVDRP